MQTINADAKERGAERAALSEANGRVVLTTTRATDPRGQQVAVIQGLDGTEHAAVQAKVLERLPKKLPLAVLDHVIGRVQVHKAKVQGSLRVPVLVNAMLSSKGIGHGAEVWPVACLGGRAQLLLLCAAHLSLC